MVRRGRHAADDGSFGRSAGGAALRGAGLLVIAVLLGIVLLQSADGNDGFTSVAAGRSKSTASKSASTATTTPAPTTSTIPLRAPGDVKVLAANGTTVKGLAGKFKDRLSAAGYNALAPTDASKKPTAVSAVYFVAGFEGEAKVVAELLAIPTTAVKPVPTPLPVVSIQGANIIVVIGNDLIPVGSSTTTSTTMAGKRSTPATTASGRRSTTTTTRG